MKHFFSLAAFFMLLAFSAQTHAQDVLGCTVIYAPNYNPEATVNDGSCTYEECSGCTFEGSPNYDPTALIDDGSCTFEGVGNVCQGDLNGDGVISTLDLLDFLSVYGEVCPE